MKPHEAWDWYNSAVEEVETRRDAKMVEEGIDILSPDISDRAAEILAEHQQEIDALTDQLREKLVTNLLSVMETT